MNTEYERRLRRPGTVAANVYLGADTDTTWERITLTVDVLE